MCLKRKKTYEAQVEKLAGARMTIETQVMTLEGANVNLEAMNAMKMGATTMKAIHRDMDVDKVDDTMEEIREQMDIANEISDAIAQPLGGEVFDDDELLNELEELEQTSLDEQLLGLDTTPAQKLPSVPTKAPVAPQKATASEDDELKALEASMM